MFKKHLLGFIRNPTHDERRVQPKRMIDTYAHRSVMQRKRPAIPGVWQPTSAYC